MEYTACLQILFIWDLSITLKLQETLLSASLLCTSVLKSSLQPRTQLRNCDKLRMPCFGPSMQLSCMYLIISECLKLEFDTCGAKFSCILCTFLGKCRRELVLFEISEMIS